MSPTPSLLEHLEENITRTYIGGQLLSPPIQSSIYHRKTHVLVSARTLERMVEALEKGIYLEGEVGLYIGGKDGQMNALHVDPYGQLRENGYDKDSNLYFTWNGIKLKALIRRYPKLDKWYYSNGL